MAVVFALNLDASVVRLRYCLTHADIPLDQVISDFDEMKALIARLHLSVQDGEDDGNEAFMNRSGLHVAPSL